MDVRVHYNESNAELRLGGPLTIRTAEQAREALVQVVAERAPNAIDLAEIDDCDTAGVQILVAMEKSLTKAGKALRVIAMSGIVRETAAVIGVSLDGSPATNNQAGTNGGSEEAARG